MKPRKKFSNLNLFLDFYKSISLKRRNQLLYLLIIMVVSGIFEIITISSLLPFLIVIIDSEKINNYEATKYILSILNINSASNALIPITFIFIFAVLISALVRLLNLWLNSKLVASIGSDLSSKIYKILLSKKYEYHINHNSSKLISTLTANVDGTVTFLTSYLYVGTSFFISLGIVASILLIDWKLTMLAMSAIGMSYILLAQLTKNKLKINGENIVYFYSNLIKTLQEGLGAIREVIINSSQITYLRIHRKNDIPLREAYAQNNF